MKVYCVGGAVRDQLLGLPVTEHDYVVVGGSPEQLLAQGYIQVGKDFPVFIHPETGEEYALARTERKVGPGYAGFSCYAAPDVTLEADLIRRDLTINAIAMDENENIIDPYGGRADLDNRVFRHVSNAFVEDPLRILRLARFSAKLIDFQIAPETLSLCRTIVDSGELAHLSPERIWRETEKALLQAQPSRYFSTLQECGALTVLFPDIEIAISNNHTALALQLKALDLLHELDVRNEIPFKTQFESQLSLLDCSVAILLSLAKINRHTQTQTNNEKSMMKNKSLNENETSFNFTGDHYPLSRAQVFLSSMASQWITPLLSSTFSPESCLAFFHDCDAFRRPEQLFACICVSMILSYARLNTISEDDLISESAIKCNSNQIIDAHDFCETKISNTYPDIFETVIHAFHQARAIKAQTFIEQGIQGNAIKEAIDQARLNVIRLCLS